MIKPNWKHPSPLHWKLETLLREINNVMNRKIPHFQFSPDQIVWDKSGGRNKFQKEMKKLLGVIEMFIL